MKDFYYRKDIQKILNISRRIIEGYEKYGLIESFECISGMKHYSKETLTEAATIRFLQKTGLSLLEIKDLFGSRKEIKEILEERKVALELQKSETERLMKMTSELIDNQPDCEDILKLFEEGKIQ